MTDIPASPVVCGYCGTTAIRQRAAHPRCQRCGVWLVADPHTAQWVSFAERERRQRAADTAAAIAASAAHVAEAIEPLRTYLRTGWRISTRQARGAAHQITVDPPPATINATAYLTPSHGEAGWYVRVHNRDLHIDYPLYRDGGIGAARYDTAAAALHAAIEALRIDMVG